MPEIHFLYLIASGNNDSVYKVGVSVDPASRLRQIKATYNVPNAYIVETMDVRTRTEVLSLEAALHARFQSRRTTRYGGREFFKFSQDDLEWARKLYRANSDEFAQAQAYYGLEIAAAELRAKAQTLEQERQRKISYNRRHGKTYNTQPSGDLKRYNKIKEKINKGHLGERFEIRRRAHPCNALSDQIQAKAYKIVSDKTSLNFLKVAGIGLISGFVVGASSGSDAVASAAMAGGTIGLLSGSFSQAMRSSREKSQSKKQIESEIDACYPSLRGSTQIFLADRVTNNSFLLRDYLEREENLRNKRAMQPIVNLPAESEIYSALANKNYFPKIATIATISLTVALGINQSHLRSQSTTSLFGECTPGSVLQGKAAVLFTCSPGAANLYL